MTYPCYHIGRFAETRAAFHCVRFGEVILDQAKANVVTHLVKLLVDLHIVAFVIFAQLRNDGSIRQDNQLGVDLVYSRSVFLGISEEALDKRMLSFQTYFQILAPHC